MVYVPKIYSQSGKVLEILTGLKSKQIIET